MISPRIPLCFLGLGVLALVHTPRTIGGEDNAPKPPLPSLLVILQGYLAHRDAFPFLSCQFTIVETKAASVEAGLRGEYNAPKIVHRGSWYLNGKKERLRVACNEALVKKIRDLEEDSIPIVIEDWLTDGKYRMMGGQAIGIVNFYQPGRPARPRAVTPFNFYGGDFDEYLSNVLADPTAGKVNGYMKWQGHELVSVTFSYPTDPTYKISYGFDTKQGYLPLVHQDVNESSSNFDYILRAKRFPANRWFPERLVSIQHLRGAKEEFRVWTVEVTSLDVSSPPLDSAFDFDLSEYSHVLDPDRASSVYHPDEGERIKVGEMHKVAEKLDAQVASRSHAGAGAPPSSTSRSRLLTAFGILVVLVGLSLILWWRRKGRRVHRPNAADDRGLT